MSDSRKVRKSIFPHYTYSLIAITPTGIKKNPKRQRKEEKINKNQNTQRKERKKNTNLITFATLQIEVTCNISTSTT